MNKPPHRFVCYADRRPWLNISLRTAFALFGGYGVALLAGAALAVGLPLSTRADAAALAVMLAFALHVLIIIWVFSAATLLRASLGLIVPGMLFGVWLQLASRGTLL